MSSPTKTPEPPAHAIYDPETFDALARARKRKQWQLYLNAILIIGIVALGVALLLLNNHSIKQDTAIQQLSSSLSTTCGQTNKGTLPVNVRQDCALAQSGQVPQIVAGIAGKDGKDGTNGTNGVSPPCLLTASQCVGSTGSPGKNGTNGINGINGINGTNGVTPPCLATASQCVGATGANGKDGANGANGSPATTEVYVYPDGSQQTCVRDPGSPETAPAYTCSQTVGGSAAPTATAPTTVVGP